MLRLLIDVVTSSISKTKDVYQFFFDHKTNAGKDVQIGKSTNEI